MTDIWDTYLQPIQRIIDQLASDQSEISALSARLRKVAGDVTEHTDALKRVVGTVDDAWNGEAAESFVTYMSAYPNAATELSSALTSCANMIDAAATALATAKGDVQTIYNEKRLWLDEQRSNSSSNVISMTSIRIEVDDGVSRAAEPKRRAVDAVTKAVDEVDKHVGVSFFTSISPPSQQTFTAKDNPGMRWIPDPAYSHGNVDLASYTGTGTETGAGPDPASGTGAGSGTAAQTGGNGYGSGGGVYGPQNTRVPPNAHSLAKNPRAGAVIDYALAQLGDRYVWGATGPNSFDCSGLTLRAYQAAGINIPRVAADQWFQGPRIPDGTEQAGDLIFFDNNGDGSPDHVGIVLDPEKHTMIHAPNSHSVVRIESYANYSTPRVGFSRPGNH